MEDKMNSLVIVEEMCRKATKPIPPTHLYYVVFIFSGGLLLKIHTSRQAPNIYMQSAGKSLPLSDDNLVFSYLSFENESDAVEVATNIILDCKPLRNDRLPNGHKYLFREKVKQYFYFEEKELDEIFIKHGIEFAGKQYVHHDILLHFPSDRIKKPLHEDSFYDKVRNYELDIGNSNE